MNRFILILLLLAPGQLFAQVPAYYHDSTLDSINNNIGMLSSGGNQFTNFYSGAQNTIYPLLLSNTPAVSYEMQQYGIDLTHPGFGTNVGGITYSNSSGMGFVITNAFSQLSSNFGLGGVTPGSNNIDGVNSLTNPSSSQITIANASLGFSKTLNFNLNNPDMPTSFLSVANIVRLLQFALMWFWFFRSSVDDLKSRITEVMNQRQVQGSSEEILGVNASVVFAIGYATVVTIAIGTVLGILVSSPFFFSATTGGGTAGNVISTVTGISHSLVGWDFMTAWFPVYGYLTIFCYWFFFSRFVMWPLFMVVRSLIFWLPS